MFECAIHLQAQFCFLSTLISMAIKRSLSKRYRKVVLSFWLGSLIGFPKYLQIATKSSKKNTENIRINQRRSVFWYLIVGDILLFNLSLDM